MLATIETTNKAIELGFKLKESHQYYNDEDATQPLIPLAWIQEWLREKNIICEITHFPKELNAADKPMYKFDVHELKDNELKPISTEERYILEFETYSECLEEAIKIGLNYVNYEEI